WWCSCTGAVDANYTISYVAGNVSVTPVALQITASSTSIAYAAAAPSITASYLGFLNSDNAASLSTLPSCSTTYTQGNNVGSYTTSCTGAVDANYTISYVAGSVSVTPVALQITASSTSIAYAAAAPSITASYLGFLNSDNAASLSTLPSCSTTYTQGNNVGSYTTSCTGAVDANYTISYVAGSVSVTPVALQITASSSSIA